MKAELFYGLEKLEEVSLSGNLCIDEDFDEYTVADLLQSVAEKCGYCEDKNPVELKICQTTNQIQKNSGRTLKQVLEGQANQTTIWENFMNKTFNDNTRHLVTIARLEAELSAAKEEIIVIKKKCQPN